MHAVKRDRTKPATGRHLARGARRCPPPPVAQVRHGQGHRLWHQALSRFLSDGRLEIDNNIAERALRGVAVGRRNWLFAGSRAGGERAAALYTVIQTCKANNVDPQGYIADVIARVADDWPANGWDEPIPSNWSREPARLAA